MWDNHPVRRALRWTGVAVAVLAGVALLALALVDLNVIKHPIERMASARFGRSVTIAGRLQAHMWSLTPGLTLNEVTVGNPPWERARPMLQAHRLQVRVKLMSLLLGRLIVQRLEMDQPVIYLHRAADGRANWTFERQRPSDAPAGGPSHIPLVQNFIVRDGRLTLLDEIQHLNVESTVHAYEKGTAEDPQAFRLAGKGTVNQQPLRVLVFGGPLLTLQPGRPYPFELHVQAGTIRVDSDGVMHKPFDLGSLGLNIRASGNDLANLYYLTQLAFPKTPPFRLQASIERDGDEFRIKPLSGEIGRSDVHGELTVDTSRKRPVLTGELVSKQLRLSDLAESLGGRPQASPTPGALSAADQTVRKAGKPPATAPPRERLLPDAHLQTDRVRAMNADVRFSASSVDAGSVPLKGVLLHIKLNDGLLALTPFEMQMPQGRLRGTATIDARGNSPQTHLDLRMTDIQLDQFKGKLPNAQAPLAGELQARVVARGGGDSVHDFAAGADGTVTFVLPHGEINAAFAELTGIDVAEGLGLLLKGGKDREDIRCGVAQFAAENGTLHAQNFVVDTKDVRITGSGEVRLRPEELDLTIKGQPKKFRVARLKAPVTITGHLLKPTIGIKAGEAVKQGAVATALGAALTPLAAVLAFVDPGLAKNENCAALLSSAERTPGADNSSAPHL